MSGLHASDGERAWYIPGEEMDLIAWRFRYGRPTKTDLMKAAGIIEQFAALITSEETYGSKAFRDSSVKFCRDAMKQRDQIQGPSK